MIEYGLWIANFLVLAGVLIFSILGNFNFDKFHFGLELAMDHVWFGPNLIYSITFLVPLIFGSALHENRYCENF